ncbi:hypothetical protein [Dechloromonas denitrificans]|nr:hypothetical protein [Dechloromonas denitrificans]
MKKVICALVATLFALGSLNAVACSAEKAKDGKQMSTPAKPKI